MSSHLSFTQFLVGHAARRRPPFFLGYATFWGHLLIAAAVVAVGVTDASASLLPWLVVASCSLALAAYGLAARRYLFAGNALLYAALLVHLNEASPQAMALFIVAVIAALTSSYALFTHEYDRYRREVGGTPDPSIRTNLTFATAALILLLLAVALIILL